MRVTFITKINQIIFFSLVLVLLSSLSCNKQPDYSKAIKNFRKQIIKIMKKEKIPGLSIAVVDNQKTIWAEGFGITDTKNQNKVTPETIFSIQSISKPFTATAIMIAVEEGLLDLNTPINQYLPQFSVHSIYDKNPERIITLRHLLSHTAGFAHEAPVGNNFNTEISSFESHIKSISDTWLRYPVGKRYSYSNLGIDLAGYILQIVSGKIFEQYVKEKILDPLGMKNSSFDMNIIKREKNRALGHDNDFEEIPLIVPMISAGGMYSNVIDISKFIQFNLNCGKVNSKQILNENLLKQMYKIPFPFNGQLGGYGLGLAIINNTKNLLLGHNGGGFGFLTDMFWYPQFKIGIVILTNSANHGQQFVLAKRILDKMAEIKTGIKTGIKTDEKISDDKNIKKVDNIHKNLIGNYIGRFSTIDLIYQDNSYRVYYTDKFYPLTFTSDNTAYFIIDNIKTLLTFVLNNNEKPLYIMNLNNGNSFDYNDGPNDSLGPNKSEWEQYLGTYQYRIFNKLMEHLKIYTKNGYLYFDKRKLTEIEPGFFIDSSGEVLDFRGPEPTWRNIKLKKSN